MLPYFHTGDMVSVYVGDRSGWSRLSRPLRCGGLAYMGDF